jgi:hypothetical protein
VGTRLCAETDHDHVQDSTAHKTKREAMPYLMLSIRSAIQ